MVNPEYIPVPVDAARQVGQAFEKGIVVIVSVDSILNLIHTTSWGATELEGFIAASLGDLLGHHAGMDFDKAEHFENRRLWADAEASQKIGEMTVEIRQLKDRIAELERKG